MNKNNEFVIYGERDGGGYGETALFLSGICPGLSNFWPGLHETR